MIYSEVGKSCAVVDQVNTPAVTNTPAQEFVPSPPSESARQAQASAERPSNGAGGASQLHQCPEVMNPPQSAALGCEAGNLTAGHVMGMGHVHRAAKARPADAVPPPKPEACERCKKKYTADGHVKPVHWARRSQAWLCLWCVFEMPENK